MEVRNFGTPLPGMPNVGLWVSANHGGSNTGVRMKISLPYEPTLATISKPTSPNLKNKGHKDLYWFGPPLWCNTLLQCGVMDCLVG